MSEKYVVKVLDEDIDKLLEVVEMYPEKYPNDTYVNGIMYTLDWLFQLDMFKFGGPIVDPPMPLDED